MGVWLEMMFVNTNADWFFGTKPELMESKIPRVCGMLGITKAQRIGVLTEFPVNLARREKHFAIGVYQGGFLYSSLQMLDEDLLSVFETKKTKILQDYPNAQTLVLQTLDTVNLFGYALYKGPTLLRAYGGDGDHDITIEKGDLQPEEKPFFDMSWKVFGTRWFIPPVLPIPCKDTSFGGELGLQLATRFTGHHMFQQGSAGIDTHLYELRVSNQHCRLVASGSIQHKQRYLAMHRALIYDS